MSFTLWKTLTSFFTTPTGQHWDRSNVGSLFAATSGDPVWVDSSTASSGYNVADSLTYTYSLTAQDFLGDQQASVLTVATTTMVFPFLTGSGSSATAAGVADYSRSGGVDSAGVLYWVADGSNYDLDYRPFSDTITNVATSSPALAFTGAAVTLESNVSNPDNWTFTDNPTTLLVGYSEKVGASSNFIIQAFNTSGTPAAGTPTPLTVLTGAPTTEAADLEVDANGNFHVAYTDLTTPGDIDFQSFNSATGALGSVVQTVTPYATVQSFGVRAFTTGNDMLFVQGVTSGSVHSFTAELINSSGTAISTPVTFSLASASEDYFQDTTIDSSGDTVLVYADNSVVTMAEFNSSGVQIGSNFTVPGITSFDRIRSFGDGRIEIDYRSQISGSNNQLLGLIYDTRTAGNTFTGTSGADMLAGTPFADSFTASTGNDEINGGPGANTIDYSGLTTPGLVAIVQGAGGTVNKGGASGTDTLANVQTIIDNGTGRSNGDVFEVDAGENITANSSNFNYLIELSAGVNLAYGTNFTGISEFVSNVGTNTVSFATDTGFAYVYGSTGNDTLTLGSGGGYLFGEGGTNVLTGGANATNLFVGGDGGSDTMNGGTGGASNFYFVDGNDQVNGAGAFNAMVELVSGVTVQLGSAQYQDVQEFVAGGGTNAVTVASADSNFVYLYGGAGNDMLSTGSGGGYLFGEGGTNVLTGGGGLNVFVADGASGVDTMNGGSGSNVYFIDANSTVNGAGTFNTVVELQQNVSLAYGSSQLGSDIQEVVLNGGTNTADFSADPNAIYLYGGAGTDTLFGGSGNDFLYGGGGTNTFGFKTGWGMDTIMDWTAGTNNLIDLTALSGLGVHAVTDLTQTITGGNDVITSSHTGTNSITLMGVGAALTASSFHFA
jgi:Ca2+-binding RTX toxin-like protein